MAPLADARYRPLDTLQAAGERAAQVRPRFASSTVHVMSCGVSPPGECRSNHTGRASHRAARFVSRVSTLAAWVSLAVVGGCGSSPGDVGGSHSPDTPAFAPMSSDISSTPLLQNTLMPGSIAAASPQLGGERDMCAQVVELDGDFYFASPLVRVVETQTSWEWRGEVVGPVGCDAVNTAGGQRVGVLADGVPLGTPVFSVPTDPSIAIAASPGSPIVFRREGSDVFDFKSTVTEIAVFTPELILGESSPAQRLATITDSAVVDVLMEEARDGDRIDTFHADNKYEFVVELVRDDGISTSIGFDPVAGVLGDRAVGDDWLAVIEAVDVVT